MERSAENWSVYVIELGPLVPPFLKVDRPAVWVKVHPGELSVEIWKRQKARSNSQYAQYLQKVIEWSTFTSKADAEEYKLHLAKFFAANGRHVNPNRGSTYSIYVFDLESHPNSVYVGQTTKRVEERLEEHRKGKYFPHEEKAVGQRRFDLEPQKPEARAYSLYNALALEATYARKCANRGYVVHGDGLSYEVNPPRPTPATYGGVRKV